jgi:hypothetical protein
VDENKEVIENIFWADPLPLSFKDWAQTPDGTKETPE